MNLIQKLSPLHVYLRDFIRTNLYNLISYSSQFFNLLYHVGNKEIKKRVRKFCLTSDAIPYLLLTDQITVPDEKQYESKKSYQITLITNAKIKATENVTIAPQKQWAIFIEQLGTLGGISLESGKRLNIVITLPVRRPERIDISKDGKYLLIAYDDEKASIFQLSEQIFNSELTLSGRELLTIDFLLPEFEPPVFRFKQNQLIFQSINGDIICFDCANLQRRILVPQNESGDPAELVEIASSNDLTFVGFRGRNASYLYFLDYDTATIKHKYPLNAEIKCGAFLSQNEFIVLTLDRSLIHFRWEHTTLSEVTKIILKEEPNLCVGGSNQAIVFLCPNHLFVYTDSGEFVPVSNLPKEISVAQKLVYVGQDEYAFITPVYLAKFILQSEERTRNREFVAIIQGKEEGHHIMLEKIGKAQSLIQVESQNLQTLDCRSMGYASETLIGIDGRGDIMHLWIEGVAEYYDKSSNRWKIIRNLPLYPVSVVGDEEHGFWITNENGLIFYLESDGRWHSVFQVKENIKGIDALKQLGPYLIWNGIVLKPGPKGTEFFSQIHFFLKTTTTTRKITHIGSRIFSHHNGLVGPISYDPNTDQFYMFLFSDKNEFQNVRTGHAQEFIEKKENLFPIRGLDQSINYCQKLPEENKCYLIGSSGGLFLVDMDRLKILTMLVPNIGIYKMVGNQIYFEPFLLSNSSSDVYSCRLIRKDLS